MTVRVQLPPQLRALAAIDGELRLAVEAPVTVRAILDALEQGHPVLRGTIREHETLRRRKLVRFFVLQEDWSHEDPDAPLPEAIASGREPFVVIGAMAGG